jgi:signal transduction histidine kinase/ActR/RegA family two-component response regulator
LLFLSLFAVALWLELALHRGMGRFTFVAFGPAIAIAALAGGLRLALAAIGLSILASDYFLLGPGQLLTFDHAVEAGALAVFATLWTALAMVAGTVSRRGDREIGARLAAERRAAQSHRLAQSTAALGQVRTSAEAIEAAIQEPLHWLGAAAGIFFLLDDDATHVTVARAVAYPLKPGDSWPIDAFGPQSPFTECLRRLAPVVIRSADSRKPEFAAWAREGPWGAQQATLMLPLVVDRRVVALLQVDFPAPRDFTPDDHEYIHMLCSRAAQALSRTWWYEAMDRAREDAESLKSRADAELVERQKTEQALRASETRYRALATRTTRLHALTASLSEAASVTGVAQAIASQAHVVVGASAGNLRLIAEDLPHTEPGTCSAEALSTGRPVFVGSMADAQERFWRSASLAADNGFESTAALPLVVKGTSLGVLEFFFSAPVNFDDEYQALLVSVAQHCTQALDRARLYEQAQHARAEAEAANKLKDEFVSTVSHELRTPLNAILGWTSMLRSGSIDKEVVPQALESVYRNASRQAKLVDDLLDFSRIAGGRMTLDLEAIHAPNLIRGIVESVTPLAVSNQIEITLQPIPEATIRGDVRRLEQVFVNLLGNALKFTQPGGHIMVSARTVGRHLEVRVADDGIGIDPEFLPFVFDRFRQGDGTTTRNHPGLGLGLSIAKQLVDAHKGSIRVESGGMRKGTAFVVALPIEGTIPLETPAKTEPMREVDPTDDGTRLDGVRVLVVDDEEDARELIGHALEERGATIATAENSEDAFDILEHDDIDVLLADIAMPGDDGYSLIRRIRASDRGRVAAVKAAAVTAHARDDERREALAAGFHAHVAKPVEPFELVRLVNHLIHDRRGPSGM